MPDRPWNPILVPSAEQWGLKTATRTGGPSFSGTEQLTQSPAARWAASLTIPCGTPAKVLAMRAALALGRSQVWIVGPVEVPRAPWGVEPWTGGRIAYATQSPSASPPYGRAIDFILGADAPLNATALNLTRQAGGHVTPGHVLSIGHRLHTVVDLLSPDPTHPTAGSAIPGDLVIGIRPWTRDAHAAGTPVKFGRPTGRMRLASDDTGALQLSRFGTVSLDLVEAV